jgi:hypothetical protein
MIPAPASGSARYNRLACGPLHILPPAVCAAEVAKDMSNVPLSTDNPSEPD